MVHLRQQPRCVQRCAIGTCQNMARYLDPGFSRGSSGVRDSLRMYCKGLYGVSHKWGILEMVGFFLGKLGGVALNF